MKIRSLCLKTLFTLLMVSTQVQAQTPWTQIGTQIIKDPSTYVPAGVGFISMKLDWISSEPFSTHGWNEKNPNFTVSGFPNSPAKSQHDGNRVILSYTLQNLAQSSAINLVERVAVERVLIPKYPSHTKSLLIMGTGVRWVLASYLTYTLSHDHLVQWRWNVNTAQNLGWR